MNYVLKINKILKKNHIKNKLPNIEYKDKQFSNSNILKIEYKSIV